MIEQRLQQRLFDAADALARHAETLAGPLAATAQALVTGLTAGGRVLLVGFGEAALVAGRAARALQGTFERERPGLAAMLLPLGAGLAPADETAALERSIGTWAQPGDQLWLFVPEAAWLPRARAALAAAQQRDASCIAWLPAAHGLADALHDTDVQAVFPTAAVAARSTALALELQLAALHAVLDAVDLHLLGEWNDE